MGDINELVYKLSKGLIDRRAFMAGASMAGLGITAATSLAGKYAKAATPKRGGHFRIGMGHGATTEAHDPGVYTQFAEIVRSAATMSHLTELLPNGDLVGDLAESWEASPDAKTWIFKLRNGVEFHNGKSVTGEDVVVSINHHKGEDSNSAMKSVLENIISVKATKNEVTIKLQSGDVDLPYVFVDYHLPVMMAKDGKPVMDGTGSGAYTLQSFEPGVRSEYARNPNYYHSDRAFFDQATITTIADVAARQNALATKEVDFIDRPDIKTLNFLKRNKSLAITEVTGSQHATFPMHMDVAPFNDPDVRMALKLAIDRKAIVDKVLYGHGTVGNDHPISPATPFHDPTIPQRSYDPEKAKWHLKKAGQEGLSIDFSVSGAAFAGSADAGVIFQESAKKAGININVIREPSDGYWDDVWLKKPFVSVFWNGRPTPGGMFEVAYKKGAPWNESHFSNDMFDKLLLEGSTEQDPAKRAVIYGEMQRIVRDEGSTIVPMFMNYLMVSSNKIAHADVAGNRDMDGGRIIERWWFK